ncbi:Cytochrome b-c1 complex subunit 7-2 [Abeliophyllum distichum]|uniref:Complex III subunit VII n=1 Tax=Abeliophyllum distichum TaxID=126358 RepID=A0ABD1NVI1_9LAMI
MASSLSRWLVDPNRNPLAAIHKKTISTCLRKYGLRYDDLYDPMYDLDVKEAMNWLPREIVDARNQRLKRALDLSMKHEYLPKELQLVPCMSAKVLKSLVHHCIAPKSSIAPFSNFARALPFHCMIAKAFSNRWCPTPKVRASNIHFLQSKGWLVQRKQFNEAHGLTPTLA